MTLPRSVAIVWFCLSLSALAAGQQRTPAAGGRVMVDFYAADSVEVDSVSGELNVPNVFTPNNDGINDYFEVRTDGSTVYEFSIFTRTGTRIFYSASPRIFWDGRSNAGKEMREGTYYYVIKEPGSGSPAEHAGFIHLFR